MISSFLRNVLAMGILLVSMGQMVQASTCSMDADKQESQESDSAQSGKSLFVVDTANDTDMPASLERISGDIDRGYSNSEQTFKSKDHYKPSPFGRQESEGY